MGSGQTTLTTKTPFTTTLLTTTDDPVMEQKHMLREHVKDTYGRIYTEIHVGEKTIMSGYLLTDVLPDSYMGLIDGAQTGQTIQSNSKLQTRITQLIMERIRL